MTFSGSTVLKTLGTLKLAAGAEISAYHASAKLVFSIGGTKSLSVVDLSDPSKPSLNKVLDLTGPANSVAVSSTGLVAVAVEGEGAARYTEGKVVFFKVTGSGSAAVITEVGTVAVGVGPDSLAFSPDGSRLVVANEAEPNELYSVDPEGSISVLTIDEANPASSTVATVDFKGLNGREAELRALGIRLSGKAGTTAAQDLEPEYVAISGDGGKAYVTFQENNSLGIINLSGTGAPSLTSLRSVAVQDYVRGQVNITAYDLTIPSPGTTAAGALVPGGGLSGLYATGRDSLGRLTFLAPADRGPNGNGTTKDVVKADGTAGTDGTVDHVQPFLLPDYQARFYKLALDERTGVVSVLGEVKLTQKDGKTPITGRSNGKGDQIPVDVNGNLLAYDPYGADLESIVQDKEGNIWMSDEYRPSIYKFSSTGQLIERYVPTGAAAAAGLPAAALGVESLPAEYAKRQTNRGFEGLAYDPASGKLYAFVQSPLDDVGANDGIKGSLIRILEFDVSSGKPTAEYLYPMAGKGSVTGSDLPFYENKVDKIGDVAYDASRQVFYVLERDSTAGALSYKQIFEVSLKGATNILGNNIANEENVSIDNLAAQGIKLANKVLLTNLASEGYLPNDKPEGLALLADGRLAVINDNDFGVTSLDAAAYNALSPADKARYALASDINGSKTYVYANPADARTQLGLVSFVPTFIDPSDTDGGIKLLKNQNLYGLRMPDGIAAYQAKGIDGTTQTFTVIANEGDGRVRPDGAFTSGGTTTPSGSVYSDEVTAGITGTAPDNRLNIIKDLGDYDPATPGYEQRFAFGGRSITILDSLGNVVWDSGDLIDKAAIAAGVYDDKRSDNKGSEQENLAVASIGGRSFAFVGLERGTSSSVVTFDVTNPYAAYLIDIQKSASGITSPEGIAVISAAQSPNGKDLLLVSNEVSKDLEIKQIDPGFSLQILHYYGESGLLGIKTAPIMGALIDKFDDQFTNTLVIGEGDSFIPGPWLVAGADPSLSAIPSIKSTALARPDVAIMNLFGTTVSALGNHEYDLGSPVLSGAFAPSGTWVGGQFPFITGNLDFSGDSSLKGIADSSLGGTSTNAFAGKEASDIKGKIAPYAIVTKGGEKIGVVGATTWDLLTKSSPNGTKVKDDANDATSDLQEVAAYVQESVNKLIAAGVNKVVMVDQLDGLIDRNKALAPLLSGVDVMVAGGGHERLGDSNDTAVSFNGHDANFISGDAYPIIVNDKDGKPTLIVTTDTEYSYLGRLVVNFDANGNVITGALDDKLNGAYAASAATLKAAYGSGQSTEEIVASSTIGKAVAEITTSIDKVISSKDGRIYGYTKVYLEGDRVFGRAQEINLGDLTADANLFVASKALGNGFVLTSLKNGGGIRASIGTVDANGVKGKPVATDVKPAGAISQLEIENALRFDNKLMLFDTTPAGLLAILNYAAGLSAGNGGYAQIGGIRFSFDPSKPAGQKVQDVAIIDLGGTLVSKVVDNGVVLADAPKTISMVTLNFMANGGDGYPIKANATNFRYLLTDGKVSVAIDPSKDFTAADLVPSNALGEQAALQSYLKTFHGTPDKAYAQVETSAFADLRIQNLAVKVIDTVFPDGNVPLLKSRVAGLNVSELLTIGESVNGYRPTGTPDGMGAYLKDANTIRLLVQSEITKTSGYAYKLANGTELTGARIHYLDIDKTSNQVIGAGLAYTKIVDRAGKEVTASTQVSGDASGNAGLDRLCAANLIEANAFGSGKGFVDRIHFLGEESSTANNNLGGTMYGLDVASGTLYALPDFGFGSWESATALDTGNTNQVALLLGDDYASASVGAAILLYVGTKSSAPGATFAERNGLSGGKLYAWVADQGAALNRPSEFKGYGATASGQWLEIATRDASKAGTSGYDALGYKSASLLRADADSKNAFLAARIEDVDFNPNRPNQVAFVATGNETFDGGSDLLGTVYTLDVNFSPVGVPTGATLKIVYDGDDAGNGPVGLRSPDNISYSKDGSLYIQEDKAVYGADADVKYGLEKGAIWQLDPKTGKAVRWAQIDDSIDPDGSGGQALDKADSGYKAYGWESSGILDASALYGHAPGTDFFANVQTHGVKGGAISEFNLAAGGQILKLESTLVRSPFTSGVASGDPYRDSVILWTRIDPTTQFGDGAAVNWELATGKDFNASTIIKKGTFATSKDRDWTVKVEVEGLAAGTEYFYRFIIGDNISETGRTKTLAARADNIHLGVFSCANFTATNEFLAYGRAADINSSNPYDAFLHLGDYIYEYGKGGYSSAEDASKPRGFLPDKEIISLDDYRQRYAQYQSDASLRELRASAPLIAIWDDHETANDSYKTGAENHQPSTEGDWIVRRDAALKAYYEWMPIREPQLRDGTDQGTSSTPLTKGYRSFDFGDVLSLHILETRLLARDKQLAYPTAASVQTRIAQILSSLSETAAYAAKYNVAAPSSQADAARFGSAIASFVTNELVAKTVNEAYFGNRAMLGAEQLSWLKNELSSSKAAWQLLGSGTLMMNMAIPAELLLNAGDPKVLAKYAAPLQKLAAGQTLTPEEQALFNETGKIPYNLDAWDGYGAEREEIIKAALELGKKLVNLAGDTHNAWAGILDAMSNADIAQQAFPTGNFLVGTENRSAFKEVITSGEQANNGFRFNGTPDGMGVIDNGSSLRVLVNHEFSNSAGAARAHGSKGAYVSDLVIDKATLAVVSGGDFLKSASDLYLANAAGTAWTNGATTAFARFCSGDLAAASAFKTSSAGYDGRIYLTGEENGAEGRAFAHIVTGTEAGRVYELPSLGNLSFENIVANPKEQVKTVAIALDDSSVDGQVYVYVGNKSVTGNAVEQAGLAGGKLFGVKVGSGASAAQEVGDLSKPTETGLALSNGSGSFSLVDLGDVKGKDGATLNADSKTAGVTNFLRPEDGAWSLDGKTFYFATTASTSTASRLWALEFSDSSNPEAGGTIKMLLNGSEGQMMFDNLTVGSDGNIILQEDPGSNDRLAKIWSYNVSSGKLTEIAQHDPALFTGANKITNDEESSGVVEITSYLNGVVGYDTTKFSYYLVADQIHKAVSDPAEQVEQGQLSLMATSPVLKVTSQQAFPTSNFLVGTENRSAFKEVMTAGELANNGFRFNGTPDGMGVIDNGSSLRVLVNHEFSNSAGAARAHGSKGAYVSDLVIDKATLAVVSGGDFLKSANDLYLANAAGTAWTNGATTAFARFCSGDLASASAFKTSSAGYDGRIYLTGEENGAEGRAFAHIVTGTEAGRVYELPSLGNLSFENIVANPKEQAKTVAIALDDSSVDGQVYVYIGAKSSTGNAVEKAGLAGGKLFGVKVGTGTTAAQEVGDLSKPTETGLALTNGSGSFSLVDLGDVKGKDGATINTDSKTAGVTNFNRPEDGCWSLDGKTFYFATTASTTTASRLWALEFSDPSNPESGGTIKMLLNGSEGQMMFDNLTVGTDGTIILQEDPGANDRVAKIWSYTISTGKLTEIGQHDPALFSGANKITNDEESSGVVEVTSFLTGVAGYDTSKFSYYLVADQVHKAVSDPAEQVEQGQLSLMAVPKVTITPGTVAGIELATPGVSSPGFEKYFPGVTGLDSVFEAYTKDLRYSNLQDRGFLDLNINKTQISAGFEYLKGIDPTTNQPTWERDSLMIGINNSFRELPGFNTPLLKPRVSGLKITEVFTIGEAIGHYMPTGTPDGMGAYLKDANTIRLLVQSEITKSSGYAYKLANGTELTGARIHYLDIDKTSNQVIGAGLAYSKMVDRAGNEVTAAMQVSGDASGNAGLDRLCAANLIEANAFGAGRGFVDRIHFLGEESSSANNNLGGTMYGLDVASGTLYALPDFGFGSWESATALDTGNTNQVALLLGDDYASVSVGAAILLYVGTKSTAPGATFAERNGLSGGKLYAWVANQGTALNRPSEFKGYGATATGQWVEIAARDISKAGTTGYDPLGYKSASLLRAEADSKNAFLAARIEDVDYNPNKPNQVAFVATGNETFDNGADLLGTVYTLDVSFSPAGVPTGATLKIVYDGDDAGNGPNGLRSPDNIAYSKDGFLYIQEDKAVYGADADVKFGPEKGSIWKLDSNTGKAIRWAQIDDAIDPDGSGGQALDKTDSGYKAYGWESSGILDASALYGHAPGTDFFANVQTHGVKGGAITDFNLAAGGQILKLEKATKTSEISYSPISGGEAIKARLTPIFGQLLGQASLNRLSSAPQITNQPKNLQIGQTGVDFKLGVAPASLQGEALASVDLAPLLDGLNAQSKHLSYFVHDTSTPGQSTTASPFVYDPIKKVGAQLYDLNSDGSPDLAELTFKDGGSGDKDGQVNGVIVDPSVVGVVDLKPILATTTGSAAITIADPSDLISPAAVSLKIELTGKASSVNQIGYVALSATEPDTLTYDLLRDRGTILLANLESSDTPNLDSINLEKTLSVVNGQKIVLFEVVDTTLDNLLAQSSTIQGMGSSFRILDVSKSSDNLVVASKGGNLVSLTLLQATIRQGINDLVANKMSESPLLDFRSLSGRDLTGSVSIAREAAYDATIGFYQIQRPDGAVLDPVTNQLITPGAANYGEVALNAANLFSGIGPLSVGNKVTRTDTISAFRDAGLIAPYAKVTQTGDVWFAFKAANSDGLNHFRTLGSGSIGLEDKKGGFDQDFDDIIVSLAFKSVIPVASSLS